MKKFPSVVETYLGDRRRIRASGGATGERSGYGPLANLINDIGAGLRPKVFCVSELADQGAGHPDFGLYAAKQVQRAGQPRGGELPEHGVVEVKPAQDDAWLTAESAQVSRYWGRYRLVLVTNYPDFLMVGEDADGNPARLESFRLAADAEDFDRQLQKPRAFAHQMGVGLGEYLRPVLPHETSDGLRVRPRMTEMAARSNTLGETTYDIHLKDNAYWRTVPAAVWNYRLGGYQVLKKWLSYRERKVLERALRVEEVQYFSETARRIGALLELAIPTAFGYCRTSTEDADSSQ